jgi:hypothetical protein
MMNDEPQTTANADSRSLENLHDIVIPEPAAWWPPASGWYVLGALVVLLVVLLLASAAFRWWSRRYRRAAIAELELIRQSSVRQSTVETIAAIDRLLKRVALAAWPRSMVANLSGDRWLDFLRRTSVSGNRAAAPKSDSPVKLQPHSSDAGGDGIDWTADLRDLVYSKRKRDAFGPEQVDALVAAADRWIRTHHVEELSNSTLGEDCG